MGAAVVAVGLLVAASGSAGAAVTVAMAAATSQRVQAAADAAALAGADALLAILDTADLPCDLAANVAIQMDAEVVLCEIAGVTVTVTVRAPFMGLYSEALARAGPA